MPEEHGAPLPARRPGSLLVGGREASLVALAHCVFSVPQVGSSVPCPLPFPERDLSHLEAFPLPARGRVGAFPFSQNSRAVGKGKRGSSEGDTAGFDEREAIAF